MDNEVRKSGILPMLALVKKNIVGAFDIITKSNIFKVRLDNDKVFYSYMAQINTRLDKLITSIENLPKIELKDTPASIQIQTMGNETIKKIVQGLVDLKNTVQETKLHLPQVQQIRGSVDIKNQQYVPYDRMLTSLKAIEEKIGNIKVEIPQSKQDIKFPEFPKQFNVPEMAKMIDVIKELKEEIQKIPKNIPEIEFPKSISVSNFPPQKYPMPISNININPLRGEVKTRAITVTTALTPLPDEVLSHRRSLTIYNNGSVTVYIGGSTMTTSDGLPIPAGTYSPALDAEATYNITATETITATIPAEVLTGAGALVASPTFTVTATSATSIKDIIGVGVIPFAR